MATRPENISFPQPATLFDRVRSTVSGLLRTTGYRDEAPLAQPLVDLNPVQGASPAEEGAQPARGTYSRAFGGFNVDPRWLSQLAINDDSVLMREGAHDLKLYDALLDDDICASAFQQRRLAVISRPWEVEPGDESPQAKLAADHLRDQLKRVGWDAICDKMLYGRWYGYAVGELMFDLGPDGKIQVADIIVPDRRVFAFTNGGELRLRANGEPAGESLPPNKFWAFRTGASHDFAPYGVGLAHWAYWPVWFKKNVLKFWAVYLEKFGMPTTLGTFPQGATEDDVNRILQAAMAVASDRAVVKPDNMELELLAEGRSSSDSYLQFVGEMNDALLRIILSQTGTSKSEAQGLGGSQSETMKDVRDEVVRSDSDMLHESFNRGPARWLTAWNFGPDVAPPTVYRKMEDEEDVDTIAERDAKLKGLGWERTEESFREIYGEGYEYTGPTPEERAAARAAKLAPPQGGPVPGGRDAGGNVVPIDKAREKRELQKAEFAAMDPRPLYVSRKLQPKSAGELLRWAKSQGIPNLVSAADLHVTVLYSKAAVDWFDMAGNGWDMEELRVPAGGPRIVSRLGEDALVLQFASDVLSYRHEGMVSRGASHDHDDYRPHVTVGKGADFDLSQVEPFQGELLFGPEIFEDLEDDWQERTAAFSAEDMDRVDRWAARLASGADPIVAEFAASLKGRLGNVTNADQLRVALLEGLERFPSDRLGELAGLPFAQARAETQAGLED